MHFSHHSVSSASRLVCLPSIPLKLPSVFKNCHYICVFAVSLSPRDLDCLSGKNRVLILLPVEEVFQTLNDLIAYFQLPDVELEHEERQIKLRSLKNRQNLFKQEVSFTMEDVNQTDQP